MAVFASRDVTDSVGQLETGLAEQDNCGALLLPVSSSVGGERRAKCDGGVDNGFACEDQSRRCSQI
jgi:hypothetical protein